jgi:uncharacterized cupin superfamily protein
MAAPRLIHLTPDGPEASGMTPLDLDPADFQSPVPQQNGGQFFQDTAIGLTVGVWDTTTMQEAFGPYPGDEFIWVLEGNFAMIDGAGQAVRAGRGDCVAFRNGAPMSWQQEGYLRKFFITLLDPVTGTPRLDTAEGAVIVMDPDAPTELISAPGAPVEREHVAFANDTGTMTAGIWECDTADFGMGPFGVHEFVKIIAGEATIIEADGTTHHLKADDCFFIPKGTECQWRIPVHVKKFYAQIDVA